MWKRNHYIPFGEINNKSQYFMYEMMNFASKPPVWKLMDFFGGNFEKSIAI